VVETDGEGGDFGSTSERLAGLVDAITGIAVVAETADLGEQRAGLACRWVEMSESSSFAATEAPHGLGTDAR
jgi:hypothetical protein